MESNFIPSDMDTADRMEIKDYYTVLAIDEDCERCFIKFIGIYSTYELAKDATIQHHNNFGKTAECHDHFKYKIFSGIIDKNVEIDADYDLLYKEKQDKYNEEHKEEIEIKRKKNEENRKRMEKEKQEKIDRVTEIFNKISCNIDATELNIIEMEHIIDFYDKYTILATTNTRPNAKFVIQSLKNFEVISNLGIKNYQTDDYLSSIMDTYIKHGIKGFI